jgi:AraC-like DNA-binding protein
VLADVELLFVYARAQPKYEVESMPNIQTGSRESSAVEEQIVRGVVDYIEENFTSSISLRHVARALGYSPAHLTHRFSSITGTPVTAWIIKRRLSAAQELLVETKQDVVSVCEAVGFGDVCYFTRQFVRHVGVTPAQFRSKARSSPSPVYGHYTQV